MVLRLFLDLLQLNKRNFLIFELLFVGLGHHPNLQ